MGQKRMLREHTVGELERSGIVDAGAEFKGVEVALTACHLHRNDFVHGLMLSLSGDYDKFYTESVVETSLVDDVGDCKFSTAVERSIREVLTAHRRDYAYGIPTGGNGFLPLCEFRSLGIVICMKHGKALGFGV